MLDVGAESCAEVADETAVCLAADVAEREVEVVDEDLRVDFVDVADSAVELVDDFDFDRDAVAVEALDPPVMPPFGVALAELRTRC